MEQYRSFLRAISDFDHLAPALLGAAALASREQDLPSLPEPVRNDVRANACSRPLDELFGQPEPFLELANTMEIKDEPSHPIVEEPFCVTQIASHLDGPAVD